MGYVMLPPLRLALPADIPAVVALLNAAFGQRPAFDERFRTYLGLEPQGWVVAEEQGAIVGVGGFVVFGRCAYIGLMGVAPAVQRRGLGGAIFDALVARCEARGLRLLMLDATAAGAPVYAKRGFRDHGESLAFAIDPRVVTRMPAPAPEIRVGTVVGGDAEIEDEIAALDASAFGADRAPLVRALLRRHDGRAFVAMNEEGALLGYAIAQRHAFGPCAARSAGVARALLHRACALPFGAERVTWLVSTENREAIELAGALGEGPVGIRCMTCVFRGTDREVHRPAHDGEDDCEGVGGARSRVA